LLVERAERKEERVKVWLEAAQVDAMLEAARRTSSRDYAMLQLLRWGLRVGEIVGCKDRTVYTRWKDKEHKELGRETCESIVDLPGIRLEDVRRDELSIWVRGKGGKTLLYPIPEAAMTALIQYAHDAGLGPGRRLFEISESKAEDVFRYYAREAGIQDWDRPGFGPHRFRAFFATDAKDKGFSSFQIRDAMRHSKIQTTEQYVGRSTRRQLRAMVDKLAEDEDLPEEQYKDL
jgi:integrase